MEIIVDEYKWIIISLIFSVGIGTINMHWEPHFIILTAHAAWCTSILSNLAYGYYILPTRIFWNRQVELLCLFYSVFKQTAIKGAMNII